MLTLLSQNADLVGFVVAIISLIATAATAALAVWQVRTIQMQRRAGASSSARRAAELARVRELSHEAHQQRRESSQGGDQSLLKDLLAWPMRGMQVGSHVLAERPMALLARLVQAQWETEVATRRIADPKPFTVPWAERKDLLDAIRIPEHRTRRVIAGEDPSGRTSAHQILPDEGPVSALVRLCRTQPVPRLVILGASGSGKTTVAMLLTLALLRDRRTEDPVPVLLSASSWDASREPLVDWVGYRMTEDYPVIRTLDAGLARELTVSGRILPLVDGLDELPSSDMGCAMEALRLAGSRQPVVVICRTDEYIGLIEQTGPLPAAAVVEMQPVQGLEAAEYLEQLVPPGPRQEEWRAVLPALRSPQPSPLVEAFSNPLLLAVARQTYDVASSSPAELLDRSRFGSPHDIEKYLLNKWVASAFSRASEPFDHQETVWSGSEARRWLAFLARDMCRRGTRDVAWWELGRSISQTVSLTALGVAFVSILASLAAGGYLGMGLGTVGGLMVGSVLGASNWRMPARFRRTLDRQSILVNIKRTTRPMIMVIATLIGLCIAVYGSPREPLAALAFVLSSIVTIVLALWSVNGIATVPDVASSPRRTVRVDRAVALLTMLGVGVVLLVVIGTDTLLFSTSGGPFPTSGAQSISRLMPVPAILGATMVTAYVRPWPAYQLSRGWYALTGRLPWRLMTFLDDAHRRGMLRQVGATYQFRHAVLQKSLASDGDE
jgi:hypothetical protein